MKIDLDDEDIIRKAWRSLPSHESSLNQCISYIRRYLLIVDFDIKDRVSNREQLVPLAVWESGALLKKRYHGWDTSMPMIGIKVDGHQWECFLFFELEIHLVRPCITKLYGVVANMNTDGGGANTFRHHLELERDLANPLRSTYPDGVRSDEIPGMVQRAYNRRMGAG